MKARLKDDSALVPVVHAVPAPIQTASALLFNGLDRKVISMYSRGMKPQAIRRYFELMYGADVSADSILGIIDSALAEVEVWQSRPLEPMYPVVFFETVPVKVRDNCPIGRTMAHLALAVLRDGHRDVLGVWIESSRGDEHDISRELRNRGVSDILITVISGADDLALAIKRSFPTTSLHTDILMLIRQSLGCAYTNDRCALARALRPIYTANTSEHGKRALSGFADSILGQKYPIVPRLWHRAWMNITPFFALPLELRQVICATSAVDHLSAHLRRAIQARDHFSNKDTTAALLGLTLREASYGMARSTKGWKAAMRQFAEIYDDRFLCPHNQR